MAETKTRTATSTKTRTATSGMSKEEEILAYSAIAVLVAAIGFVVGAIFMGRLTRRPSFCTLGRRATPNKNKAPGEGGTGENRSPGAVRSAERRPARSVDRLARADRDSLGLSLGLGRLRRGDGQHAIVEAGGDLLLVELAKGQAAL